MRNPTNFHPAQRIRGVLALQTLIVGLGFGQALSADKPSAPANQPPVPVPSQYKSGSAAARSTAPASFQFSSRNTAWWSVFQDPTLDSLERSALEANQDLRESVERVLQARADARKAAADFFPTITAPLHANRQRTTNTGPIIRSKIVGGNLSALSGLAGASTAAPGVGAAGASSAASGLSSASIPDSFAGQALSSTYNDFQAEVALSYELDVFGRIRHSYRQAVASAQASEADRRSVELSLTTQVAATYFNLRTTDSQYEILRRTIHLREEAVQLQSKRVEAGAANDLDLARARLELANAQAQLEDAMQQRNEAENSLAVLCGQVASDFHLPLRGLGDRKPPLVPAGVPAQLLGRRPDLIEAERKLAGSAEGVKVARAQFLPTFNVQADYGYESADVDQWFDGQSRTWSVTGSVSVPIFEGGRNTANLKAAKARQEQALAEYKKTMLTALKEVENALSGLQQRERQSEARGKAAESASRVLDMSEKGYREGAINYFEVIDAQRSYLEAELSQTQALSSRYQATIDLIRAIGGSYEMPISRVVEIPAPVHPKTKKSP